MTEQPWPYPLGQAKSEQEPVAINCRAKRDNGGVCPHHNLQCGWPDCNKPQRMKPKQMNPAFIEQVTWTPADTPPPPDHDVLVTFEGTRGAYIAAWMGPDQGWIGVDALPLEKVAWWAVLPPGPGAAMTAAAAAAAASQAITIAPGQSALPPR